MQFPQAKTFAQLGALGLLLSLVLPWYGFDVEPIHLTYGVWHDGNLIGGAIGVGALIVLLQPPLLSPGGMGTVFMCVGGACALYIGYRIVSPPSDVTTEVLKVLHLNLHPKIGVFLAELASISIAFGGWLQVRYDREYPQGGRLPGHSDSYVTAAEAVPTEYLRPEQQAALQAQARYVAPTTVAPPRDPFAPGGN